MASRKPKDNEVSLPFAALQLLAPPVRLVSAALWKVLQQKDVMQYGVVEEFVTSACETVPGLLTSRHQAKLALGLRARLILELCSVQPDMKVIQPHLERIRAPAASKKDVKIIRTVEEFHTLVHALLTEPAERKHFFQEEFPVEYGAEFDRELAKLLWEFLIRLDQLLPVPNLAQTVSWLSDAPPVLEECARSATQPQLLEIILQHQACLGHLEAAASLPPNMGNSILASLSLPLSGRVQKPSADQQRSDTPVFGLICNKDAPVMRTPQSDLTGRQRFTPIKDKPRDGAESSRSAGVKRKQLKEREQESSEEEEEAGGQRKSRREDRNLNTNNNRGAKPAGHESKDTPAASSDVHRPQHSSLSSLLESCLNSKPRVVIERLSVQDVSARTSGRGEATSSQEEQSRKEPVKEQRRKQKSCQQTPEAAFPALDDKENLPLSPVVRSSVPQQRVAEMLTVPGGGDDYVADSEDEATKNFKSRLFRKRYFKTKHGTYVPTLREFLKPRGQRCSFPSASGNLK